MSLLKGKRLLVTGVLTDESMAYGVADLAQREGAEVVLTNFGRGLSLTKRVAKHLPVPPDVLELDVTVPQHLEAVVADLRHRVPGGAVTAADLERAVGDALQRGDRLLLRTDCNKEYFAPDWAKRAPYLTRDAVAWVIERGVVLVGFDFYHGADEPDSNVVFYTSRTFGENGVVTMPYLNNLDRITRTRVTLLALPLKMLGVEASPVRAVVIEDE